jgi:demethylspheroidene O-methyltransferase
MTDARTLGAPQARAPEDRPAMSLADRLHAFYERLVSDPRFQRWASAFPLTRPVARRRARGLFDLCAGFVYSQVLLACVRLDLFDILAAGPLDLATLASRLQLSPDAARRLLEAAVSLDLVSRRSGGRYGLGAHGAALRANPGIAAMVEHHALVYRDLADPVALLRGTRDATGLGGYWPYSRADDPRGLTAEQVAGYSQLMSASQPLVAGEILDAYPLDSHKCLLDVGGGEGTFLRHVADRAPHLRLMLFDLPQVAARATMRFAESGLGARATAYGGDFRRGPLPAGADIVSLVRVLHDHDDESVLAILRSVRAALPAGGRVLIGEPMAQAAGAKTVGAAYFGFYLLAMGQGRARTVAELGALLKATGFGNIQEKQTNMPLQTGVLVADATV